jgi:predicted MFS family arabinose efflux permease
MSKLISCTVVSTVELPQPAKPTRLPRLRDEPNMWWYLAGQAPSLTCTFLQTSALALLVVDLVGKQRAYFWGGVMWACGLIPGMFLGPRAGVYLDFLNKRKVMYVTQILSIAQALALALLVYTGTAAIWNICVLALFLGFVNTIDGPARNAIIKEALVHKENQKSAMAAFSSLYNIAQVLGPIFAVVLINHVGYTPTLVINALSFVAVIVALVGMKLTPMSIPQNESIGMLAKKGREYINDHQDIRSCIHLSAVICACGFSYMSILPVAAQTMFPSASEEAAKNNYSLLSGALGVGAFIGSLVVTKWMHKRHFTSWVVEGCMVTGLMYVLFALTHNVRIGMALMFVAGYGLMTSFSTVRSTTLERTDKAKIGVVLGHVFRYFFGGIAIAAVLEGYVARYIGGPQVFVFNGILLILTGVLVPRSKTLAAISYH